MTGTEGLWWNPRTLAEFDAGTPEQRSSFSRLRPSNLADLRSAAARAAEPDVPTTAEEFRAASYRAKCRLHADDPGSYERLQRAAQALPESRR
ncbi:MAG: hypothetical protein PIR53_02700 [Nocardioides alkalitolerans]